MCWLRCTQARANTSGRGTGFGSGLQAFQEFLGWDSLNTGNFFNVFLWNQKTYNRCSKLPINYISSSKFPTTFNKSRHSNFSCTNILLIKRQKELQISWSEPFKQSAEVRSALPSAKLTQLLPGILRQQGFVDLDPMKCFDNNDGRSFGKCCSVGDYEECWTEGGRATQTVGVGE